MRIPYVAAAAALTLAGCDCRSKLSNNGSQLVIVQPTTKVQTEWILDFGSVPVGTSQPGQIVIQNQGRAAGKILSAKLRTGSDPSLSLTGNDAASVEPGGSDTMTVSYAPRTAAAVLGWVDIETDDPNLQSATVRIQAAGRSGSVQVCVDDATTASGWRCQSGDQLAVDFGSLRQNASATHHIQVKNVGTLDLSYFGTSLTSGSSTEFTLSPPQTEPAGGVAIKAANQAAFDIVFAALHAGPATGEADVSTADAATPLVKIMLTASGPAQNPNCHIAVAPASVSFGNVSTSSSATQTVTITNDGLQDCLLQNLLLTGSSSFTLAAAPGLPMTLASNAAVTATVSYQPTATSGDTGNLEVDSTDPANPSIDIPLSGTGIAPPACLLTATPASLNFGGVTPGSRSILSVVLSASGTDPCTITGATIRNGDPNFSTQGSYPIVVIPATGVPSGFGNPTIGVVYAPVGAGTDSDTLDIAYTAGLFGGQALTVSVPLSGQTGAPQLCVVPTRLHYGAVAPGLTKDLAFTMTACGSTAVTVSSVTFTTSGTPFSFLPAPSTPLSLGVGASASQTVHFAPTSAAAVSATVHLVSTDPVFPDQYVYIDGGNEIVTPSAGEVVYSWTAGAFSASGGAMEGTIFRTNLQGPPNRTAFYGTDAGNSCSGCHAVSPDGRYVALVEYGTSPTMRIVDAKTSGSIPIPGTESGLFPSWRPNVNTNPAYQFVYSDNGAALKIASVVGGILGDVQGANLPNKVQDQPSWGPNGTIVFVSGTPDPTATSFEIKGPSDLMVIPEGGGTATPLAGASGNGGDNYYPEYSPNGKFIAYTFSASGQTTRSASDSVIMLVDAANSGTTYQLPQLNAAGPNSWPTWSVDGTFLSFSSSRSGGLGSADVYFAPVDQNTGADGPATNLAVVNTANFDHIARWALLPP